MNSASRRRSQLGDQNDGIGSMADVSSTKPMYHSVFARRGSLRNLSLSSSVSSPRYFHDKLPRQPYFLEACFLCNKPLSGNKDIYMYRGDTPFCSEECRQEQIQMDEAKENEKKWSLSSMKSLRKNQKKSNSTSPDKAQAHPFRTGTVAAA